MNTRKQRVAATALAAVLATSFTVQCGAAGAEQAVNSQTSAPPAGQYAPPPAGADRFFRKSFQFGQ